MGGYIQSTDLYPNGIRLWICQTGSLGIWMGYHCYLLRNSLTHIEALRAWPYDVHLTCRCKYCRYIRMYRRYNGRI